MNICEKIKAFIKERLAANGLKNDFEFDVWFGKSKDNFDISTNVALKYPRNK